jgi:hypothetical protein
MLLSLHCELTDEDIEELCELEDRLEIDDNDDADEELSELALWANAAGAALSPMELAMTKARSFFISISKKK